MSVTYNVMDMDKMNLRLYTFFIFVTAMLTAMGAQVKIHGKITDGDNKAIEFATVRISGTAIGTTSGLDGEYSLSTAESDTINRPGRSSQSMPGS